MAYTYLRVVADGETRTYQVPFDTLPGSTVQVNTSGGVAPTWRYYRGSVTFDTPPQAGVVITISRHTQSTLLHEFSRGAAFTAANLDADLKQCLYVAAEARAAADGIIKEGFLTRAYADTLYATAGQIESVRGVAQAAGQTAANALAEASRAQASVGANSKAVQDLLGALQAHGRRVDGISGSLGLIETRLQRLEASGGGGGGGTPPNPLAGSVLWDSPRGVPGTIGSTGDLTIVGDSVRLRGGSGIVFNSRPTLDNAYPHTIGPGEFVTYSDVTAHTYQFTLGQLRTSQEIADISGRLATLSSTVSGLSNRVIALETRPGGGGGGGGNVLSNLVELTADLNAAGNTVSNLGTAVDSFDAVPLWQVESMLKSLQSLMQEKLLAEVERLQYEISRIP